MRASYGGKYSISFFGVLAILVVDARRGDVDIGIWGDDQVEELLADTFGLMCGSGLMQTVPIRLSLGWCVCGIAFGWSTEWR